MTDLRELAKRTAARGHINHTYNDGTYLENHLERVALTAHAICHEENITDTETLDTIYCIAMLHDYLEDCFDYEETSLEKEAEKLSVQFNKAIANGVLLLSRNSHQNNEEYLRALSQNMITRIVKAADRIANVLSLPEVKIKKKRLHLYNKYHRDLELFIKYDIYPELIQKCFEEIDNMFGK